MQRILLTGKNGQVGWELQTALAPLGTIIAFDQGQMDFAHPDQIRRAIRETKPVLIVNAAAYTAVDKAESEPDLALQVNGIAPGIMAEEAKRSGAILIHYSTDYVFDGELGRPYTEDDAPNPVNTYGRTKLAGEHAITAVGGKYVILRTSGVYSSRGSNFVLTILRAAREKAQLTVVDDQHGSPTWARALAAATADLLRQPERIAARSGTYHLSAEGCASRYDLARTVVAIAREISRRPDGWAGIQPIHSDQYRPPPPAARPSRPALALDRIRRVFGIRMQDWEGQVGDFLRALATEGRPELR
ncbi:MAG: dTDP-4-dehydrorhamnose reductase [Burkholderiales bacterium]